MFSCPSVVFKGRHLTALLLFGGLGKQFQILDISLNINKNNKKQPYRNTLPSLEAGLGDCLTVIDLSTAFATLSYESKR